MEDYDLRWMRRASDDTQLEKLNVLSANDPDKVDLIQFVLPKKLFNGHTIAAARPYLVCRSHLHTILKLKFKKIVQ